MSYRDAFWYNNSHMSTITVGNQEKHEVSFSYDVLWAKAVTTVDGKIYKTQFIYGAGSIPIFVQVGDAEKHDVRIEVNLSRIAMFDGADVVFFVDGAFHSQHIIPPRIDSNKVIAILTVFALAMIVMTWLIIKNSPNSF